MACGVSPEARVQLRELGGRPRAYQVLWAGEAEVIGLFVGLVPTNALIGNQPSMSGNTTYPGVAPKFPVWHQNQRREIAEVRYLNDFTFFITRQSRFQGRQAASFNHGVLRFG